MSPSTLICCNHLKERVGEQFVVLAIEVRLAAKNALAATFGVSVNDISNLHLIDTEDFC